MFDVRIINGTVVTDGSLTPADVGVEGEMVTEVGPPGSLGPARNEIDATGRYVLPGVVDVHFHCRAPSHPERGDFASETRAAAAGGVTTVCEMPISDPACSTPAVLAARAALAEREAFVDVALYAGGAVKTPAEARAMAEAGAVGFKLFTHRPSPDRAHEFEGLWATEEDTIYQALTAIASTDLVCTVHAENETLLQFFSKRIASDGLPERPPIVEAAAIALIGVLAADVGARVHVAHLTSRAALDALRGAIAAGSDISAETCPQYLAFSRTAVEQFGAFAKVAPPLRDWEDVEALWQALADGTLDVVASDHAPFRPEEKRSVEYRLAPQGMPTVETMLPIMMDAALRERLPLELAIDVLTAHPARRFGLYPRKGTISPGAEADVVLFDPLGTRRLGVDSLVSRAAGCGLVYEGMTLQGRVVRTLLRGRTVFAEGVVSEPTKARFVRPAGVWAWRSP